MVELYEHNLEAFSEINMMIESGTKKIAVPRATGSGKSFLMGALAEQYNNNKKLVLEPTRPLLDSIKEKFDEFGIANTVFMTYQKLIRLNDEDIACMDYKLIFLDECHHGTTPVWGQKVNCLMETHSDSIIFGTSATTVRSDGVNVVESLFEGNAVGELSLSTVIARKVLPCPHYITAIYRLDDEFEKLKKRIEASTNMKEEKREFYEKMKIMQSHFEKSYGIPTILNKYIKVKNGRYLVFCKDKKHLDSMRDIVIDWFKTAGIKDIHSYAVFSDYPDKEKDYKEFCADISNSAKILFSINMLNEGLHIKDISGVLMLRTTQIHLIYLQQLGRLVDTDNIDKYLLVFDFVNNFSRVNDGIGLLREIKDAVAKEKESDSDFDDSGFENIDTFFVLEQVVEIQEMFREIEGKIKGREWMEEENEILKKYFSIEGIKVIGRLNGRTKEAIWTQVHRLGLKAPSDSWTDEENNILREYYPIEGIKVRERLKGRTKEAIKTQANKLGLRSNICKPWIKEETEILNKYYSIEGLKVKERLKGRTKASIKAQVKKLGLKAPDKLWTERENKILKEYYPIEGSKVIDKLSGRTKGAIITQAANLGLKYKKHKYITKHRDKYVVQLRVNGKMIRFGTFDSEEEAAKVAMEKAREYGKKI